MNRIEHREEGSIFPFVEYSPKNRGEGLPIIIQLHGAGERGNGGADLSLVDVHGFSKVISEKDYPCIFIMPQCPNGTFWAAKVESIVSFAEFLINKYAADPERIYLTGLSMGGYGTWFTAMARPDLFAAIAPVCGGGMAWNAGVLTMPVWAFHGAEDKSVDVFHSDDMVARMKKHDLDVRYSRFDGVGHDVWKKTYDEELLNWFLQHKKK